MSSPAGGSEPARRPLTRRDALRWGGRALLGAAVAPACAGRSTPPGAPAERGPVLAPVDVAWDRIIRRVVGLRPFRPAGFVLRAERQGEQLIVHNYGHGGGGITLSWGTAELAVREAEAGAVGQERRAAVLGCGVVGLATARLLQRRGWAVTIYARDLPPRTTSNVAGGQWTPSSVFDRAVATPAFVEQFARASRIAYRHYQDFVGAGYGVRWIDNYYLADEPGSSWLVDLLPDVYASSTDLEPHEHPFAARAANRIRTMLIEPAIYLNALLRDFRIAGGTVVAGELRDRRQVAERIPERVVVNCTGLGAGALFGDDQLVPAKGQLTILFPQPEVDYIVVQGGLYMFPRSDGILLGGTFERGDASLGVDTAAEKRIVEGHRSLFAGMRAAPGGPRGAGRSRRIGSWRSHG
ncbi:MAG: FAD-binding oxidoreductase [Acidobacteria bacterium]|nr:FAD-binding oxidoreductase [Acidobacteriota bacterium]